MYNKIYLNAFKNLTNKRNLKELKILKPYLYKKSKVFIDIPTGVVRTDLKYSELEILNYWSNKIFKSKNPDDYDSEMPFAISRLNYVAENIDNFIKKKKLKDVNICDFACGQGTLLNILNKNFYYKEIYGVEGTKKLTRYINKKFSIKCYNSGLGFGNLKKIINTDKNKINFGVLSWVLCNCINPLNVLKEIYSVLENDSYLCVAESSRILVPFKKILSQYFAKRHPEDIHPWHFSAKSLQALLNLSGFKVVYINRFKDSNELLLIAKKEKKQIKIIKKDNHKKVYRFFNKWHEISKNSKNLFD